MAELLLDSGDAATTVTKLDRRIDVVQASGIDTDGREAWITEAIEDPTGPWLAQVIRDFNSESESRPIVLHLSTPGGSVDAMFAMHDAIRSSKAPVHVHGFGCVASAGVLVLACGHHRRVSESCVLMSHQSSNEGGAGLRYVEAKDRRAFDDWTHNWWCTLMARYTPQDQAWWKRTTERRGELWLLGGAAIVEAGLADIVDV